MATIPLKTPIELELWILRHGTGGVGRKRILPDAPNCCSLNVTRPKGTRRPGLKRPIRKSVR
jgi:hypothetical protein